MIGATVVEDGGAVRFTFSFDRAVHHELTYLPSPPRLSIDLPETVFALDSPDLAAIALVEDIRFGLVEPGVSRLILTMNQPFSVSEDQFAASADGLTQDLSLVLSPATEQGFREDLARQASARTPDARSTPKSDRLGQDGSANDDDGVFTVMIDPGHGGIDSGAVGLTGLPEKTVVLEFSRKLRAALGDRPNLRVLMTRDSDVFVRLSERVRMTRQADADLLVSVHGDSVRERYVRGATIYTLSDRASDDITRRLAQQENLSDQIAGVPPDVDQTPVASILLDLARRETEAFSKIVSDTVIASLREEGITVSNNPQRSGGFRVLTAPDVPSILLDIGFMSNSEDEQLMTDPDWRRQAASAVANAVLDYARVHGWQEADATPQHQ